VTRRAAAAPPSPLLADATRRLAALEADGVLEHPDGQPPNRKWITLALDARGLYGPEVDEACGGVEPMVDRWELGELEPTAAQVVLLAELTGHPPAFFYQDPPDESGFAWLCGRRKVDGARCRQVSNEIVGPAEQHRRDLAARRGEAPPPPPTTSQGALF
jgi:hypothetical protein